MNLLNDEWILPHTPETLQFLLAGRCYVTLQRVQDDDYWCYRIEQKVRKETVTDPKTGKSREIIAERFPFWFVSVVPGAIGCVKPRYLGVLDEKTFRTTRSTAKNTSASADNINLFGDLLRDLRTGKSTEYKVKIRHTKPGFRIKYQSPKLSNFRHDVTMCALVMVLNRFPCAVP